MKFTLLENIALWFNLAFLLLPLFALFSLPWAMILGNTLYLILTLLPILLFGVWISWKYFRNHLKKLHIGQKVLLFFPIINLLIISLLTIAIALN